MIKKHDLEVLTSIFNDLSQYARLRDIAIMHKEGSSVLEFVYKSELMDDTISSVECHAFDIKNLVNTEIPDGMFEEEEEEDPEEKALIKAERTTDGLIVDVRGAVDEIIILTAALLSSLEKRHPKLVEEALKARELVKKHLLKED